MRFMLKCLHCSISSNFLVLKFKWNVYKKSEGEFKWLLLFQSADADGYVILSDIPVWHTFSFKKPALSVKSNVGIV